jgi:hypothetical protein
MLSMPSCGMMANCGASSADRRVDVAWFGDQGFIEAIGQV